MTSLEPLRCPVRIFVRTRPVQLQKIHPLLDRADTELIEKLCVALFGSYDTSEIRHLITKTSTKRESEQVEIVFDYGVPTSDCQPKVAAFNVKVSGSDLTVTRLFNPILQPEVNRRVELWRSINLKCNTSFPSRTDVRRKRLKLSQRPFQLYYVRNLLFPSRPVMDMTSAIVLKAPVRVAVETSPEIIDAYSSDQLIEEIAGHAHHASNVAIQHLLTRIDRNAFIIFDCGVPDDDNGPQVFRLRLRMTESGLSCDKLSSGRRYMAYVNSIVEGKRRINVKYGLGFPRVPQTITSVTNIERCDGFFMVIEPMLYDGIMIHAALSLSYTFKTSLTLE
ncbi:hypothetical protein GP486_002791 [Trichoglossum hirsutum]|uniref:Uncharacterized protein n=1 Tax=Trichoglossum hirsutum TaxID=265104 RepID=A0A9P8RRD9_9PEZI|nr:hypothetical protein GP486_002791 [Trichoglossum hirsutum]